MKGIVWSGLVLNCLQITQMELPAITGLGQPKERQLL